MPPKKKVPKGPGRPPINPTSATAPFSNVVCPICEDHIDDDSHESIHCSGCCQSWVHSGCSGLTLSAFKIAKESGPFQCPSCRVNYLSNEISHLQQDLSNLSHSLSSHITSLESRLSSIEEPIILRSEGDREINRGLEDTTIPTTGNGDAIPPSTSKFSIVISGIPECSPGTRRNAHISHDFEKVAHVIHSVDNSISSAFIRDC
uniref:PHD-type domain-containing protein n=1 Tax=Amphimedon queenslandica TaxID=400682 RepID=A0A1X7V2Z5_AMPQE